MDTVKDAEFRVCEESQLRFVSPEYHITAKKQGHLREIVSSYQYRTDEVQQCSTEKD